MPQLTPVDYAVPFFIILILIEIAWARRRSPSAYEARDTLSSLAMGLGSTAVNAVLAGLVTALAMALYRFSPVEIGWQWWAWGLCFVLDDFNYYVAHRLGHRSRWFWASHVNHHSSQHYNLSTALRQTWTGFPALSFAFRIWPALIGFHPAMIATCGAVNLVYQFWIHTEAIGRMPAWFEAVMNTPSHHRVHHAINPVYLDRNYAGVFITWDRLLGTYQPELDEVEIHYGIVRQLGSFNLLWSVFHEWIAIGKDLKSAPWSAKLNYLIREPGWTHDGSRDTSDTIRARWLALEAQRQAEAPPAP